ncbi:hypothetical protein BDP27DRAFT_1400551 [Rhodocollybia butyracea]|uniref:Uncharacterized protein n=1 Tax=Rhodocollybia butyracea TaxID=206335 RepID=A0A9P5PUY7_9AGAR|nr:hypothetical protein BDP27DRAFT_1400551 [Rhodocollybia butyracea]
MNFGSNDNTPILVAPRPVRLTCAPYTILSRAPPVRILSEPAKDTSERSHSVGELKFGLYTESSPDASPRSSPRSGLTTEALEEFLSILRPSIFPPRSPVRSRRASLPVDLIPTLREHPFSYKGSARLESTVEEVENAHPTQSSRNAGSPEVIEGVTSEFQVLDFEENSFRWFTSSVLSSPISRTNTRNPFQRHATYPMMSSPPAFTPLPTSPAAIPLPLPSPDELLRA